MAKNFNLNAAKEFVERWQAAEGNEQREANSFWIELCEVMGIETPTRFLDFERKVKGRRIDVFYEDMKILIENKSRGVDLDKRYERGKDEGGDARLVTPFEQAKWYADNLPRYLSPRWVIVCNFDEIRIHDLDKENPANDFLTLHLANLEREIHTLSFFTDKTKSTLYIEKELSIDAGTLVGKLYDKLSEQYANIETDPHEQHSLNVLIVRLIFLLYAEDAGLLQSHQAFYEYMKTIPAHLMRENLIALFRVLDTPEDQRDPYENPELDKFPYINGGLFADNSITIPQFTEELRTELLEHASCGFNWSGISPTIFGAVFESTLNPETRRKGGMHYTSVENIHKVIDPLFLDDLKEELIKIEGSKQVNERKRKLEAFWQKLANLKFFDPACGSGNFLTETYISLCKLEIRVAMDMYGIQAMLLNPAISILQFYGIEINNFAVSVAKTALWIAEHQMFEKFVEIMPACDASALPLKNNDNIHCANALRIDWNDVLPATECNYIIGNPPFVGHQERSEVQIEDMDIAFYDLEKHGKLDYVCAWYAKALHYMQETKIGCALVSTNSIVQGESVGLFFPYMFEHKGCITFAYKTFDWASDSLSSAIVDCVIIGFSMKKAVKEDQKRYIYFNDGTITKADNINGYLCDVPEESDTYIKSRQGNVNKEAPEIMKGSQPTFCTKRVKDPADLFLTEEKRDIFISKYPELADCIREFIGADEYIKGKKRYVFWFDGIDEERFNDNPIIRPLLDKIAAQRRQSPTEDVSEYWSKRPHLFTQIRQPKTEYLIIPRHSGEGRVYIPIGFLTPDIIVGDAAQMVPNADRYVFGLITSQMHMAWMRAICGRLESRYRYTPTVYNTFVWPNPTPKQHEAIEMCAQAVLDARNNHSNKTLAYLYDPRTMPSDLLKAHEQLDKAVERAYGVNFKGNEDKMVNHLFKLYAQLVNNKADSKQNK